VRYLVLPSGHFSGNLRRQVAEAVDAQPDQGQARVACVEFIARLFKNKTFHLFTCQVSFYDRGILQNFVKKINILINFQDKKYCCFVTD
jgi:hypothetical protein